MQTSSQDLTAALASAKRALALAPADAGLAVGLGAVQYMRRDWAALRANMAAQTRLHPTSAAAWDWKAMAETGLRQYPA